MSPYRHVATDPTRPAMKTDLRLLGRALFHLPPDVWLDHLDGEYGGRGLRDLTHGEAVAFTAWAVKEATL